MSKHSFKVLILLVVLEEKKKKEGRTIGQK